MKDKVYITGHKNPDTDTICSAIAYADFKNGVGDIEAIPVRLGEINQETKFVLDYFGVEKPKYMETARLSLEDIDIDAVPPISKNISLRLALSTMQKDNLNSIPVVDENEKMIGMITVSDIIENYLDVCDNTVLARSNTTLQNIMDTLDANPILIPEKPRKIEGSISILAMEPGKLNDEEYENNVVICGREDAAEFAIKNNVALMIIPGNGKIEEDLVKDAKKKDITILSTPYDTFMTSRLITQSVPVSHSMTSDDIVTFTADDLVEDIRKEMADSRYRNYPVVDQNKKIVGLVSRYHLITNFKKKMILVDHNERSQSIDGLEEAEIVEVIDHHRIGDVHTGSPIYFRNQPVGSTATIVASIFFENGRMPSKKIAGILAAAVISDTLLLKSPTSTSTDKMILDRLAKIANLDIEKFAQEMFEAGTSLKGKSPKELLNQDFKEFSVSDDIKMGVSQVNTMNSSSVVDIKDDLLELMKEITKERGYAVYILMVTNILKEESELIVVGEDKDIVAKAYGKELKGSCFNAPGVLSRKKQIVPPVSEALLNKDE